MVSLSECPYGVPDCELCVIDKPDDICEIAEDLTRLRSISLNQHFVIVAESIELDQLATAFALGIDGYLHGDISGEALCESLKLVLLGEKVFPSRLVALLSNRIPAESNRMHSNSVRSGDLSEREVEIITRLVSGLPNKIIARQLTITEATVKVHLKNILKKLGVANRTQVAVWAVNHGMSESPGYFV